MTTPDALRAAPEERLADWMLDHIPQYNRWMTTGWRDTMRDEAIVLAKQMLVAALAGSGPEARLREAVLVEVRQAVEAQYPDDGTPRSIVSNQSRVHRRAMLALLDRLAATPTASPTDPGRSDTERFVEFVVSLTYDMPHVTPEDIGVIAYRLEHSFVGRAASPTATGEARLDVERLQDAMTSAFRGIVTHAKAVEVARLYDRLAATPAASPTATGEREP